MRIRILGGGWYGCHLALALKKDHRVTLYETSAALFSGASGNMPGRLHLGFPYPRSKLTRNACQDHYSRFMRTYGHLTAGVPVNIYAIARDHSLVDFGNYCQSLKGEVEFVSVERPEEFGLDNVEGALLTGERHTVIRKAREWFTKELDGLVRYRWSTADALGSALDEYDLTIDCTFCAREGTNVDRYEPCVTAILKGPTDRAITIMDGPFPSLYPWDEELGLCSLTSASLTPLSKAIKSYSEARALLLETPASELLARSEAMLGQMAQYYPQIRRDYEIVEQKLAVRAMPLSGADARLVDIVKIDDKTLRIRASKLDAIFYAEDFVREHIRCL